jgi:hypothetical protein
MHACFFLNEIRGINPTKKKNEYMDQLKRKKYIWINLKNQFKKFIKVKNNKKKI